MSLSRKKQNRQKLVAKLETEENSVRAKLEKYIEEKIRTQNYLDQKIAEKRLVLERKREKEAGEQKLLRQTQKSFSAYYPEEDFLVQTDCVGCGNFRLLRIDRPICSLCERRYELMYRPEQPRGDISR